MNVFRKGWILDSDYIMEVSQPKEDGWFCQFFFLMASLIQSTNPEDSGWWAQSSVYYTNVYKQIENFVR